MKFIHAKWCEKCGKRVKFQAKILKFVEFLSPQNSNKYDLKCMLFVFSLKDTKNSVIKCAELVDTTQIAPVSAFGKMQKT